MSTRPLFGAPQAFQAAAYFASSFSRMPEVLDQFEDIADS